MQGFDFLGFSGIELLVVFYFIIGSYSLGYLLLRTGWPKIRILDENYRIGWSIIFGGLFSVLWALLAVLFGFQNLFPIILTITLVITLILLSARRKCFSAKIGTVAIPKEKAAEQIVAEKSMQQLLSDKQFILNKNLTPEQVEKIRETLQKKGSASS